MDRSRQEQLNHQELNADSQWHVVGALGTKTGYTN